MSMDMVMMDSPVTCLRDLGLYEDPLTTSYERMWLTGVQITLEFGSKMKVHVATRDAAGKSGLIRFVKHPVLGWGRETEKHNAVIEESKE